MATLPQSDPIWVRYSPHRVMLLALGLSRDAEFAHRRLCDYVWSGGPWLAPDFSKAGVLARAPRHLWSAILKELETLGWRIEEGLLKNTDVLAIRDDAVAACDARRARSQAGNAARWASLSDPTRTPSSTPAGTPASAPSGNPPRTPPATPPSTPCGAPDKIREDKIREEQKEDINKAFNAERLTLSR